MATTKKSYCELDKKGMGFDFDECPFPHFTLCADCIYNIPNGKEIK